MNISDHLAKINESLNQFGADFSVGFTLDVPLKITFGDRTFTEEIPASLTEDGLSFDQEELHRFMYDSLNVYAIHREEDMPFDSFEDFQEKLRGDSDESN